MSAVAPILDPLSHEYSLEGKRYVSVSRVIDAVIQKSWAGVNAETLERAAERGRATERYATEWLQNGVVTTSGEEGVNERLEGFGRWMDAFQPKLIAAQQRVWNDDLAVAGTLDFLFEIAGNQWLVDMKCTAAIEKSWCLQVGSYADLLGHDGPSAVLHLNPEFAKGYIWREYDTVNIRRQWRAAYSWYRTLEEIKAV